MKVVRFQLFCVAYTSHFHYYNSDHLFVHFRSKTNSQRRKVAITRLMRLDWTWDHRTEWQQHL